MRTILFRGKRLGTNEWVYGSLIITTDPHKVENVPIGYFIRTGPNISVPIPIIPETVGQLAMTIEFNGKQVFEGDIVTYDTEDGLVTAKIIFKESEDDGMIISGFELEILSTEEYADNAAHEFQVIGNIHDNPELLP